MLSDEDFDKVRPESTRVIDLVQFADDSSIDPMYVDRAYYLAPDGGVAADAFAVMREGMKGKVGVGKLALYGREYLVAVKPHEKRHRDVHAPPRRGNPEHRRRRRARLGSDEGEARGNEAGEAGDCDLRRPLNLADYKDEYREGLQRIIDAKIAGEEFVAPAEEAPPKVVNLMEALKQSLDAVSAGKKKTAKVPAARPAAREGKRKRA